MNLWGLFILVWPDGHASCSSKKQNSLYHTRFSKAVCVFPVWTANSAASSALETHAAEIASSLTGRLQGKKSIKARTVWVHSNLLASAEQKNISEYKQSQNQPVRKRHFRHVWRDRNSEEKNRWKETEILGFCRLPDLCLVLGERKSLRGTEHKTFIALSGCCVSLGLFIK